MFRVQVRVQVFRGFKGVQGGSRGFKGVQGGFRRF